MTGRASRPGRFRVNFVESPARRKLLYLHDATDLKDLGVPPGNRLGPLTGNLRGFHSIRINDQ